MFWKRKPDAIKHIRDYKIGKKIEVSVYRFNSKFLPADDPTASKHHEKSDKISPSISN